MLLSHGFLRQMTDACLSPGLYGMADAAWGNPADLALALAQAGCQTIQLRAKALPLPEVAACARALLPRLRARGVRLILNDHLDLVVEIGADGVHIGQEDGDPRAARQRLPPGALLGLSTHDLAQVQAAQDLADYIGFGPVFGTTTKDTGYSARGLDALREVVCVSRVPVVAIGGITRARLPEVRAAGVRHWAVISDILAQPDVTSAAREFQVIE